MSSLPILSATRSRPSLFGLSRATLRRTLEEAGMAPYRADQIFSWIYRKHRRSTSESSTALRRAVSSR